MFKLVFVSFVLCFITASCQTTNVDVDLSDPQAKQMALFASNYYATTTKSKYVFYKLLSGTQQVAEDIIYDLNVQLISKKCKQPISECSIITCNFIAKKSYGTGVNGNTLKVISSNCI